MTRLSFPPQYSITPSDKKDQPEYKRTVYIKTAGNLATRSAVHYLERFISPEANQPEYRRAAAFWALKQSVSHHPELVIFNFFTSAYALIQTCT